MTPPAVRIAPGGGIALRTAGIVAWFPRVPKGSGAQSLDATGVVRELVLAAGRADGGLPVDFLEGLHRRDPTLSVAVVSLVGEQGMAWVCGEAKLWIDGPEQHLAVEGPAGVATTQVFALPRYAVRLGDTRQAAAWSHLVEGAVPAGGVAVLWEPDAVSRLPEQRHEGLDGGVPLGIGTAHGAEVPRSEGRFEAVPLLDASPEAKPEPLPVAGKPEPRAAKGVPEADSREVIVSGLRCSRGHFNHPLAANCAWCGIGMIQVSHVLVRRPRPPLGVLVVDGQATFTLDADYVIGREPHQRPEVDGERVREIVLASDPSISRAHLAIRLRDWDVLAEDLGSGIGSWLQQPRQHPFQLQPGHPVALAPGAVLFLGPHRLTYHSHHLR